MKRRINFFRNLYLGLLFILFWLIVTTPILISDGFSFLTEETVEIIMIFLLLVLSIIILTLYQRELKRRSQRLNETEKHVGQINVQLQNLKTVFKDIKKYPENKSDFKHILTNLAKNALGIVDSAWVMFRIIETGKQQTLKDLFQARGEAQIIQPEISNKALLAGQAIPGYQIIASTQENLNLKIFCIIPKTQVTENQQIMLQTITDNAGMLYVIFTSQFYKKN